jgi:RHS repeat-associated protein
MNNLCVKAMAAALLLGVAFQPAWPMSPQITIPPSGNSMALLPGQSATLLPSGLWLLLGGQGASGPISTAAIKDPTKRSITNLSTAMLFPRAWHSATLLPDGRVLIVGGMGSNGQIAPSAEIFDPSLNTPSETVAGFLPRAHHTATLLIDGSVLVAGGVGRNGGSVATVEHWNSHSTSVLVLSAELQSGRRDHTANLLPDGMVVLWGGTDAQGNPFSYADLYNPDSQSFTATTWVFPTAPDMNLPSLEAALPADGATSVPASLTVGLRFSKALQVQNVNTSSVKLSGPNGKIATRVVPAESGMLAFVTPVSPLQPGTLYLLAIEGPTDAQGLAFIPKTIRFTTADPKNPKNEPTQDTAATSAGAAADLLPPLQAPPGVTALSGQALLVSGLPLANVTISIGQQKMRTDRTGRFLLQHIEDGHQVFVIEGRTANYGSTSFGLFEVGTDIKAGITNILNYKIWMTPLDTAHAISIPSPTTVDTVVSTPVLPGLKLDLPAQTVIYDHYGHVVHQITITPIRLDRPPFPIPQGLNITFYFSIQPGGAYLRVGGDKYPRGARVIYPNSRNFLADTPFTFWNYDPDQKGWFIYGMGHVSPDRKEVIPDPGVSIYEFTGAMDGGGNNGAGGGSPPGGSGGGGDPVDTSTGLFVYQHTDFNLPDVIPINVTRTYRQGDTASRGFGIGTSISYDIFPVGEDSTYSYMDLILPDGGRIHYNRISPGTSFSNAVFLHTATPTKFYGSTISWDPTITNPNPQGGWRLRFKDGTSWGFPESANATTGTRGSMIFIQDRFGNTLNISRNFSDGTGDITQITSPNGRWLQFTYDSNCHRIQQITDNIGRSVTYGYDSNTCNVGHLQTVKDQNGNTTTFGYQGATIDQMTSITDNRQIEYLQNIYDSNNRVHQQILANGGTYTFNYTTNSGGSVTQASVTDPNGNVHQMNFSLPAVFPNGYQTGGYLTSETYALGKPEQQTFTYNLGTPTTNPGNFVLGVTDPLSRTTSYSYDALGNLTNITRLSGTSSPAATSFTYEPTFNRVASVTDPLGHTTSLVYNDASNQVTVTDPLGNHWAESLNGAGQIVSISDPLGDALRVAYSGADAATVTDALNNSTSYIYDGAGRKVSILDPLEEKTSFTYDGLNYLLTRTDPLGEVTQYGYDANSNMTAVTDPRNTSNPTVFMYNNMDQVQTRTDALGHQDSYQYDQNGNLVCYTDRKGQITVLGYDAINRKKSVGFGAATCAATTFQNSTAYTYDGGNRLTTAVDSVAGTVSRNYDGLDDLKYESTPQGTINYNFDSGRRRTSMTVTGQTQVIYSYDGVNHLQQITQGSTAVNLTYDSVGRRSSLVLPNGITVTYSYDSDSHISGITYQNGATTLGNLIYSYDSLGRRSQVSGSYARANLPSSMSSVSYNVANQITTWAGTGVTYDLNGNIQNDGTNTYSWDFRNQLSAITGGNTASFQYDGLRRRIGKTINGISTAFLYDGGNVIQELSGSTPTANLITGLRTDEIFARTDSAGARYFLSDALNNTLGLSNPTATVPTQYTYEPFGNTSTTGSSSTNEFQYTGRENDGTGLYFYRARYYQPGFERFASEDPIGFGGGTNLYGYVRNNPVNLFDPSGLKPRPTCQSGGMSYLCGPPVDCSQGLDSLCPNYDPPPCIQGGPTYAYGEQGCGSPLNNRQPPTVPEPTCGSGCEQPPDCATAAGEAILGGLASIGMTYGIIALGPELIVDGMIGEGLEGLMDLGHVGAAVTLPLAAPYALFGNGMLNLANCQ